MLMAMARDDDAQPDGSSSTVGRIGTEECIELMVSMLGDSDSDVRREAATSLGRLGDRSTAHPLMEALLEEKDVSVRRAEVSALDKLRQT